jgi:ParB-like chromosome segregation protein Spo0J
VKVKLKDLKVNPLRDFIVDPIDPEIVKKLRTSIKEDGFWDGIVCGRRGADVFIIAGEHRKLAAIAEGYTEIELTS